MDENVIETVGNYRAVVSVDDAPEAPYDDGSSPILRLRFSTRYDAWEVMQVKETTSFVVPDEIVSALKRWGYDGDRDLFERYVRLCHGATEVKWLDGHKYHDYAYVTFDTADWRAKMGVEPYEGIANMQEWENFLNGEVFVYEIQRRATWAKVGTDETREEWEHVDSCGGFYSREYVEEAAREALELYS